MAVNVDIQQKDRENVMGVLRRFRNRVRTSGVLKKSRSLRYHARPQSKFTQKKSRLNSLDRAARREYLYKLGKISD